MFAVVNHLHFTKPVDEFRQPVQQEGLPLLKSLPGFKDFMLVKVSEDRAIVILLWEDGASAENGSKTFGPTWFARNFAPFLASEQQRSVGPVIVSGE
jgi:heme-degrading monooxygenase HmoA